MPHQNRDTHTQDSMSVDMLTDCDDSQFLSDNLLSEDDFNFEIEVDSNHWLMNSDDELLKITNNFELPSFDDKVTNIGFPCDDFEHFSSLLPDFSSTTIIKKEPLSPNPSPPSPHGSNSSGEIWSCNAKSELNQEWNLLETPPITPPETSSGGSPPTTPVQYANETLQLSTPCSAASLVLSTIPNASSITKTSTVKANIQPIAPNPTKPDQPLVLTAEQLAKLTARGVIKLEPSAIIPSSSSQTTLVQNTTPKPLGISSSNIRTVTPTTLLNGVMTILSTRKDCDLKALKRQQRMIKNRESACLSRRKKKEYVTSLEAQVKDLTHEKQKLQVENTSLKIRLSQLEKENENLKRGVRIPSAKKTTALLAVLLMISLNLGPLSGIFLSNMQHMKRIQDSVLVHRGRSLLWAIDNSTEQLQAKGLEDDQLTTLTGDNNGYRNKSDISARCPVSINKTESQRLDNDLRGWVFISKKDHSKTKTVRAKKLLPPLPRLRGIVLTDVNTEHKDYSKIYTNDLQPFKYPSYGDFLEAIHREADRFYVVSFRGDHLLLPAISHNKTRRPFMSLVLPAIPLNDTKQPPKDHVAMMQIDCEVTNTKLVHVREELIRPHLEKANRAALYENGMKKTNEKSFNDTRNNGTADGAKREKSKRSVSNDSLHS